MKEDIPEHKIEKARSVFGITPTIKGYKEIMNMYKDLEIIYESRKDIVKETNEEINYYVECTTLKACNELEITDKNVYSAIFKRLKLIKEMSNELRPYQAYSVLVLRYRKDIFPRRLVELF